MRLLRVLVIAALAGCTPGAPSAGGGGGATTTAATTTIDVSLTASVVAGTPYGDGGGFAPVVQTIPLGSTVRFVNVDSFAHTATSIAGTSFPAAPPFSGAALTASGATLSGGWSSGTLAAGNASQPLLADRAGTYLYGCFFHYGAPMRGAIVVR